MDRSTVNTGVQAPCSAALHSDSWSERRPSGSFVIPRFFLRGCRPIRSLPAISWADKDSMYAPRTAPCMLYLPKTEGVGRQYWMSDPATVHDATDLKRMNE